MQCGAAQAGSNKVSIQEILDAPVNETTEEVTICRDVFKDGVSGGTVQITFKVDQNAVDDASVFSMDTASAGSLTFPDDLTLPPDAEGAAAEYDSQYYVTPEEYSREHEGEGEYSRLVGSANASMRSAGDDHSMSSYYTGHSGHSSKQLNEEPVEGTEGSLGVDGPRDASLGATTIDTKAALQIALIDKSSSRPTTSRGSQHQNDVKKVSQPSIIDFIFFCILSGLALYLFLLMTSLFSKTEEIYCF